MKKPIHLMTAFILMSALPAHGMQEEKSRMQQIGQKGAQYAATTRDYLMNEFNESIDRLKRCVTFQSCSKKDALKMIRDIGILIGMIAALYGGKKYIASRRAQPTQTPAAQPTQPPGPPVPAGLPSLPPGMTKITPADTINVEDEVFTQDPKDPQKSYICWEVYDILPDNLISVKGGGRNFQSKRKTSFFTIDKKQYEQATLFERPIPGVMEHTGTGRLIKIRNPIETDSIPWV